MSFVESGLSVDDYFGLRDIYTTRPSYLPKPQLIGSFPTYEQIDAYTKKLQEYEKNLENIRAWDKETLPIRESRSQECFTYFCEYVGIPADHTKAQALFYKSGELANGGGYSEVLNCGLDLVDLVL
jgi:hypothetical protein